MTMLLEQAIAKVRALPEAEQDAVAAMLLSLAEADSLAAMELDDETRAALRESLVQARHGDFASDSDIEALWRRFGG
jgi:hypothetical protein